MARRPSIAVYTLDRAADRVREMIDEAFASMTEVNSLASPRELADAYSDFGKYAVVVLLSGKEHPLLPPESGELAERAAVQGNVQILYFGLAGEDVPPAELTALFGDRFHFLRDGDETDARRVLLQVQQRAVSEWLETAIHEILDEYEAAYQSFPDPGERFRRFLLALQSITGADEVSLRREGASGGDYETVSSVSSVQEPATFSPKVGDYEAPGVGVRTSIVRFGDKEAPVIIRSVVVIDRIATMVEFLFVSALPFHSRLELCHFAARELFHLVRSTQLRVERNCMGTLARLSVQKRTKREVLWRICEILQAVFASKGVSIIEVEERSASSIKLRKWYVHFRRQESDLFEATHGYAHFCLTNSRLLLINNTFDSADPPYATGYAFEVGNVVAGKGKPVQIEYTRAPKTIEDETSVLSCPLVHQGDAVATVKIGRFKGDRSFTMQEARTLVKISSAITGVLINARLLEGLQLQLDKDAQRARMQEYAESLFLYREIALGLFHQVGNDLSEIGSELLKAESQFQTGRVQVDLVREGVENGLRLTNEARGLIDQAQRRGRTLEPLVEECLLVRDVIRPVIVEWVERRLRNSNLHFRHTLTNHDYRLVIDRRLLRESLINILSNAIWAVREHQRDTRKDILLAVRPTDDTKNVRIQIVDTGIGISPDDLARVFTPFFSRRRDGTGLGLYFARRLLEYFDASIKIARSYPGDGTTVEVVIPLEGVV